MRFSGKVAIATGGASGIGAAFVRRLHGEGASVMIADLDAEKGAALAAELGERTAFRQVDVSDVEAMAALAQATADTFGGIDILFNNAGIGCFGETPDLDVETWKRVIAINLDAVFYGSKAVIPFMRQRGGGAIVNTASASGMAADFAFTAYNAAKAGVINYTRCLAIDHAKDNIRANAICPGPVDTPLLVTGVDAIQGLRTDWERRVPMNRFARPDEIAAVAAFLASDDASYLTGASIPVDGGLTAHTGQPDLRPLMGAA
ncbi:SDR family oxidoreductase [Novosphingobium sp. KCTC 2891]|uniref:SDR family NAD(P)-dependent oxidoreductase n=1 Tax=Novosphingobium sp. KCTC 2891 TaxID=2989730 RepID=UPI002222EA34|nr:SDR family NAD(P)-dependent oxidoreductase [Novosphingobium sp. KCTC 2891]MCW1382675.1 SDR family oxidoreductase [Novosphingobium sp. KCTC 2891]